MAHLYFDESIREKGGFIIGAVVISDEDLSRTVRVCWEDMGYDPDKFEYKSSAPKRNDSASRKQRDALRAVLHSCRLALTILPCRARRELGNHCALLVSQLKSSGFLSSSDHQLFIDQNIFVSQNHLEALITSRVSTHLNQDSRIAAGIQVADHAAHALGGMLLAEMGLIIKKVLAGENSGCDQELEIELSFELWAGLRYALIGRNEQIDGLSPPPDDPANPYFRVEGYGLLVSTLCSESLATHARRRFGTNYLGCIH